MGLAEGEARMTLVEGLKKGKEWKLWKGCRGGQESNSGGFNSERGTRKDIIGRVWDGECEKI